MSKFKTIIIFISLLILAFFPAFYLILFKWYDNIIMKLDNNNLLLNEISKNISSLM